MKKTILFDGIHLFHVCCQFAESRIACLVGGTVANYTAKDNGYYQVNELKVGFTAGLIINIPVEKNFIVENRCSLGAKRNKNNAVRNDKVSLSVNSMEIPVNFTCARAIVEFLSAPVLSGILCFFCKKLKN
jgi:hypothetical protein